MTAKPASVGRSSLVLALGTAVSRLLGFVRTFLIVAALGVSTTASNAFMTGNQIPSLLYQLTAGGVLTAVLVPQIVQATRGADGGRGYINKIMTLVLSTLLVVTLLLTLLSPMITKAFTGGWSGDNLALATAFTYWCMPQVFFYGLYALLSGIYNARRVFGPYTWAPVLNNVVSIAGFLVFIWLFSADPQGNTPVSDWTPGMISTLGLSATLGVALQAAIMFAWWRRAGLSFRPDFQWRHTGLKPTFVAAVWILGMVALDWVHSFVKTVVANSTEPYRTPGDTTLMGLTSFETASLLQLVPHGIIAVSIATVYFTRFSEHAASHDHVAFTRDLSASLRHTGVLTVFAAAAMTVAVMPMARIFTTGDFAQNQAFARVLLVLMPFLIVVSADLFVIRAFYALDDTRTPFFVALVRMVLVLPCYWLITRGDPHSVVFFEALIAGCAIAFDTMVLFWLLRRRLGGIDGRHIVRVHVRLLLGAVVSAAVGLGLMVMLGAFAPSGFALASKVTAVVSCALLAVVMGVVYIVMLRLLRVDELGTLLRPVVKVLGRLRSRG